MKSFMLTNFLSVNFFDSIVLQKFELQDSVADNLCQ